MHTVKRVADFVFDNSLLLLGGAVAALLWANLGEGSYKWFSHLPILHNSLTGRPVDGGFVIDVHFLVNDILMAFFFAMAGREVWMAFLPGGQLNRWRQAATPIICAVGGMIGPAVIFTLGVLVLGRFEALHRGWAIPTATDIAFSYMVARIIFGAGHPAIPFLLLLAIADDALGLVVLAVFYPQGDVNLAWLGMSALAIGVGVGFWCLRIRGFWWYLLVPGAISWYGFVMAGLHPALGLLPIIPVLPHVHIRRIHQGWDFVQQHDPDWFDYIMKRPVEIILCLFGILNAGVVFRTPDPAQLTVGLLVLVGLLAGKPTGIVFTAWISRKLGFELSDGLTMREIVAVGFVAGIGFTVALFVTVVAFPPGEVQDAAKLGALSSFAAAPIGYVVARMLGIKRITKAARATETQQHQEFPEGD